MKLRQANKIYREVMKEQWRSHWACDTPRIRHSEAQINKAIFVQNKHLKMRVPVVIDGVPMMRAMGGLANEAVVRALREKHKERREERGERRVKRKEVENS